MGNVSETTTGKDKEDLGEVSGFEHALGHLGSTFGGSLMVRGGPMECAPKGYANEAALNEARGRELLLQVVECIQINSLLKDSMRISAEKDPVWELIYSSERDGKSWSILQSKLVAAEKCLILFQDKDLHLFGGYFPKPLIPSVNFQNDTSDSFICSRGSRGRGEEALTLYFPTGLNQNHIYYNYGSKSFPNGIGMGGQIDYFAFFISSDFESGSSRAEPTSTTFGSPQLSGNADFILDACEVWLLEHRNEDSIEYKRSIRENVDVKAILELAGREMHSQNYDC